MSLSIHNLYVNRCHYSSQAVETQGESRTTPLPDIPRALRAPLRDISPLPPTLHDDDIDMEPRRKRPTSNSLAEPTIATSSNPRSIKSLPNRLRKSGEISERERDKKSETESIPPGQRVQNSPTRERQGSFDFDLITEADDIENMPQRPSQHKGKGRAIEQHSPQKRHPPDGYSSDYGIDEENMFEDDGFWEVLDRVEKEALEDGERSNTQSKSKVDSDGSQKPSTAQPTPSVASANDVIELDDDSDEDANKENAFVPMRHVRRKTEELVRGRSPTASQNKRQPSRNKKATVITPCDVIDISDSD